MLLRISSLLAAALVVSLGVTAAQASVPDANSCTLQSHGVVMVGTASGVPDAAGAWSVVIRKIGNQPLPGSTVMIDFTQCSDIVVACNQQGVTNQVASGHLIYGITDTQGRFTFYLQGSANVAALPPDIAIAAGTDAGTGCAPIYADGVLLGQLEVTALDLNGRGSPGAALDGSDVALAAAEAMRAALGSPARARDDYNFDGHVDGADVALLARRFISGATRNTGAACP